MLLLWNQLCWADTWTSLCVSYPGPRLLLRGGGYDITTWSQIRASQYERNYPALRRECRLSVTVSQRTPSHFDVCAHLRRKDYWLETSTFFFVPPVYSLLVWLTPGKITTKGWYSLKPLQDNRGPGTLFFPCWNNSIYIAVTETYCIHVKDADCCQCEFLAAGTSSRGHSLKLKVMPRHHFILESLPWQVSGLETSCIPRHSMNLFSTVCWPLRCVCLLMFVSVLMSIIYVE